MTGTDIAPKTARQPETGTSHAHLSRKIIAEVPAMDFGAWRMFLIDELTDQALRTQVRELAHHAADPNPFFDLPILDPAARFIGDGKIQFLCLSRTSFGGDETLRFFAPVKLEFHPFLMRKIVRVWSQPYAPLGTPLIDRRDIRSTVSGLVDCLVRSGNDIAHAVVFNHLPRNSAFSQEIYSRTGLSQQAFRYNWTQRAGLGNRDELELAVRGASGKRRQRLNKAARDLQKLGPIAYESADSVPEIMEAFEQQLVIENRSWKGTRGTSILRNSQALEFSMRAIRQLASERQCRIYVMKLDRKTIASMVVLRYRGHYFPWKIAFDEAFRRFSVGNLLLVHVNENLLEDPDFVVLDSLASELNETAKRFWCGKLEFSSMVIGLGERATHNALRIAEGHELVTRLKYRAKQLLGRSL